MDKRKVQVLDALIIVTDATKDELKDWIRSWITGDCLDLIGGFQAHCTGRYMKLLYDAEEDTPDIAAAIGYDERYGMSGDRIYEEKEHERRKSELLYTITFALKKYGMEILDESSYGQIVVHNNGPGPNFLITVQDA